MDGLPIPLHFGNKVRFDWKRGDKFKLDWKRGVKELATSVVGTTGQDSRRTLVNRIPRRRGCLPGCPINTSQRCRNSSFCTRLSTVLGRWGLSEHIYLMNGCWINHIWNKPFLVMIYYHFYISWDLTG